jgi:hypothetical protein
MIQNLKRRSCNEMLFWVTLGNIFYLFSFSIRSPHHPDIRFSKPMPSYFGHPFSAQIFGGAGAIGVPVVVGHIYTAS